MSRLASSETSTTRRDFIKAAGGVAASLAVTSGAGRFLEPVASAIEPITRQGSSKFKYSLAAYSYRNLLTSKQTPFTLEDFISDCAKMHLDGTELTGYYFPPQPTLEYLRHIKEFCFRLGLNVSGTAIGNDFCHPPGAARDEQVKLAKRWVDYAEVLGAPVIRIFSGKPHDQDQAAATKQAIETIEECCQYAGEHGVYLALENHGGLTAQADDMLALVRAVRSPWFGVNLDTGNFHSADIYGDLAKLAPYAVNVQVKVVNSGPKGKEPTDFDRLAKLLASAGYRGYIVLEYEEAEDPRTACPRYLDEIRKAFGKV